MFDIVANANYNVRSNHQMLLQVPNIRTPTPGRALSGGG